MADELLRALGRLQREQQAEHARAGPRAGEPGNGLAPEDRASILAALLGEGAGASANTSANTSADAPAGERGTVVPFGRPARRRWLAGVTSLAAAAALFLVLRPGADPDAEFPVYGVTQASGEMSARGSEPAAQTTLRLRADTMVDLIVTPASPVRGPVDLRAVAIQGEQRRWIEVGAVRSISADGVVRLRGRAGAWLGLPAGTWTLDLVIGRPERLPIDLDAYAKAVDRPAAHGWQIQQVKVQIED